MVCVLAVLLVTWVADVAPPQRWVGEPVLLREDGLSLERISPDGERIKVADLDANKVYYAYSSDFGDEFVQLDTLATSGRIARNKALSMVEAEPFYSALVAKNPTVGRYHGRLGTAQHRLGVVASIREEKPGVAPNAMLVAAKKSLDAAIRLEPTVVEWRVQRFELHHFLREYDHALKDATELIRLEPREAGGYVRRAMVWMDKKDLTAAIKDYDEAIRLEPKNAVGFLSRGDVYLDIDEWAKAEAEFTEAIRLDPKSAAYAKRGGAQACQSKWDDAIADCTAAIKMNPKHAHAYYVRGVGHTEKKDNAKAEADFDEVLRLAPRHFAAYKARGDLRRRHENKDGAIADYAKAIELDPNAAAVFGSRGWVYMGLKDYAKAERDFAERIRINPRDGDAYMDRAVARRVQKKWEGAVEDATKMIELLPATSVAGHRERAEAYFGQKDYARAEADLSEAIRRSPDNHSNYTLRAVARSRRKDYANARADFDKSLKLFGGVPATQNDLAWFLATCPDEKYRDGATALRLALENIKDSPTFTKFQATLAAAHAEVGHFDLAVAAQGKAISILKAEKAAADAVAKAEKRLALYRDKKPYRDEGE